MYKCIICNHDTSPLIHTLNSDNNFLQYRYCSYCFHIKSYNIQNHMELHVQTWPKTENYLNTILGDYNYRGADISSFNYNDTNSIVLENIESLDTLKNNKIYKIINLGYLLSSVSNPSFILQKIKKNCDSNTIILALSPRFKFNLFNINSECESFFNTSSFKYLLNKHNLFLHNVKRDLYNYVFDFSIVDKSLTNITSVILEELEDEIYTHDTYDMYNIKSTIYKNTMDNLLLYNNWNRLHTYNNL